MMLARAQRSIMTARPYTFPVATGGWNAVDALDAMAPDEAETLINWFPETTYPRLRRGYTLFCETSADPVESLATYNGATDELLACYADNWYEVTTGTPALLAGPFANSLFQTTNYATAAGQYLIAVNGADVPQIYDGATMVGAVNTIGGAPAGISINRVCIYNQRVYYAEKDTLSVWYLPVGQYQGALTEYDLGPLCAKGGSIASITTWTRDNASAGANEMFVVVTNQGEVLIFTGEYPGGTWQISARFEVGEPVSGPHCVTRIGPDCVLICDDGFQPMAHYLQLGESQAQKVALSRKIGNAVTYAVKTYGSEVGWEALLYPAGNMLIFNIPRGNGIYYQYVVNTLTGAWCEWRGQNARCWALFGGRPYFGGEAGNVWLADNGTSDYGADIAAEYRGSYQYIGGPGLLKRIMMAQPVFQTTGSLTISFGVDVDFNNTSLVSPVSSISNASAWGGGVWGAAIWGSGHTLQSHWISVKGLGYAVAPHFLVQTGSISVNLMSINLTYERGAFI